jgi:hypothetical protein
MGHGGHFEAGVMFLLTAGIVGHETSVPPDMGSRFSDTPFGAGARLHAFRPPLGFRPQTLRWPRDPAQRTGIPQR